MHIIFQSWKMKKSMQRPVLMGIFSALHFSAWINLSNDSEANLNEKTVAGFAYPFMKQKFLLIHIQAPRLNTILFTFLFLYFSAAMVSQQKRGRPIYITSNTLIAFYSHICSGKRPYIYIPLSPFNPHTYSPHFGLFFFLFIFLQ